MLLLRHAAEAFHLAVGSIVDRMVAVVKAAPRLPAAALRGTAAPGTIASKAWPCRGASCRARFPRRRLPGVRRCLPERDRVRNRLNGPFLDTADRHGTDCKKCAANPQGVIYMYLSAPGGQRARLVGLPPLLLLAAVADQHAEVEAGRSAPLRERAARSRRDVEPVLNRDLSRGGKRWRRRPDSNR
jgi:hypothetical protein